jgi:hypothetical protein
VTVVQILMLINDMAKIYIINFRTLIHSSCFLRIFI